MAQDILVHNVNVVMVILSLLFYMIIYQLLGHAGLIIVTQNLYRLTSLKRAHPCVQIIVAP